MLTTASAGLTTSESSFGAREELIEILVPACGNDVVVHLVAELVHPVLDQRSRVGGVHPRALEVDEVLGHQPPEAGRDEVGARVVLIVEPAEFLDVLLYLATLGGLLGELDTAIEDIRLRSGDDGQPKIGRWYFRHETTRHSPQ
jgi:hypothetical protein